jgi:Cu/Ag efflux protein CusF
MYAIKVRMMGEMSMNYMIKDQNIYKKMKIPGIVFDINQT